MDASELLSKRAQLTPDRVALVDLASGRRYTFAQMNRRANQLAHFLRDRLGVEKGDRVSILAQNNVAYVDLLYGLGKIGAILAPLNWRLVARELVYIVNDCQPKVLFCDPELVGLLEELRPETSISYLVSLDGAEIEGAWDYEQELVTSSAAEPQRPPLNEDDPYCILYTSGTTGRPKGAIIPHRQVLWNCINTVASWGLTENDISPILTPMFHAGGLFVFLAPLFYVGGRIVLARSFDTDESLRVIEQERCTVVLGVPTLFQMWMESPLFDQIDFSHLRWFISGGAPCPVSLMDAWRAAKGVVFRQGYGLTEVGVNCFCMTDEDSAAKAGSVGKPVFHSQVRIVDEDGRELPAGQAGELTIAGPHVCAGYWRNPQATAEALREGPGGPWFHTGDMARVDEDGYYYIVGRCKDMIISGGENVYAAEVEAVYVEHPAVAEAALVGQPDEKWGETGLLIVVLEAGQTLSQEELQAFGRERLARYKVPKRFVFVDALPYSPYGKVMKVELKKYIS